MSSSNTLILEEDPLLEFKPELERINIDDIIFNHNNPREKISRSDITDLIYSIRSVGTVLVPIVVSYNSSTKKYLLLDGERRVRASKELAKIDKKFQTIPANIITKKLDEAENLQVMLNIHMKRKQWNTAAVAEALGKIIEKRGYKSRAELKRLTGMTDTKINDSLLFLRAPEDLRQKCLTGDLKEYNIILLSRNLEMCEKNFPSIFKKHNWEFLIRTFIEKVEKKYIRRTRDFLKISNMANDCIELNEEDVFLQAFDNMIKKDKYTIEDAEIYVYNQLKTKFAYLFDKDCEVFRNKVELLIKNMKYLDDEEIKVVRNSLGQIIDSITKALKLMEKKG